MTFKFKKIMWIAVSSLFLLTFQNCTPSKNFSGGNTNTAQSAGNGGSYDGKLEVYRHFDPIQPCTVQDRNGNALANDVIIFKADAVSERAAYLARRKCLDVTPMVISPVDLSSPTTDSLLYKNETFTAQNPPGEFDVVIPACPAGKTPKAAPVMVNEFASALNWLASPWQIYQGIGASLFGTIASLPSFQLVRNDARYLESWRRAGQDLPIKPSTEYAFSFLAQPGSDLAVDWTFFRNVSGSTGTTSNPLDESAVVTFNLQTLTTKTVFNQHLGNLSATITPVANGFQCTVYFTSTPTANQGPIGTMGVMPSVDSGSHVGDSVIVTDAQFVPVNQFCQ